MTSPTFRWRWVDPETQHRIEFGLEGGIIFVAEEGERRLLGAAADDAAAGTIIELITVLRDCEPRQPEKCSTCGRALPCRLHLQGMF